MAGARGRQRQARQARAKRIWLKGGEGIWVLRPKPSTMVTFYLGRPMWPRRLLAAAFGLLLTAWLSLPAGGPADASTLTPCTAPGAPGISVGSGIQELSSQDLARELSDLQTLGV